MHSDTHTRIVHAMYQHTYVACTEGRKIFAVENIRDAQIQCISEIIRELDFRGSACAHTQCI